jgi:uncharacterized protein YqfA (UPF0365 family)
MSDGLIIVGILFFVIGFLFGVVYLLPPFIIRARALMLGLEVTLKHVRIISKKHGNRKDFLLDVKEIWNCVDIPIEKLIIHYLANGDLSNLRNGIIIKMTELNRPIDFPMLTAIDLAGGNLIAENEKAASNNWVFGLAD